jgi:hypothetical protein
MNNRRISKRINTTDPNTFIELAVSYNKPPDYVDDRLPNAPYYLVVVMPVKVEGLFEIRTAFTGYRKFHAASARFSKRSLDEFAESLTTDEWVKTAIERVANESGMTLA